MKSIICLVDTQGERGNFNKYELDVALESALDALESDEAIGDLEALREIAKKNRTLADY